MTAHTYLLNYFHKPVNPREKAVFDVGITYVENHILLIVTLLLFRMNVDIEGI